MARFPRSETDIITFTEALVAGLQSRPAFFPNAKPAAIQGVLEQYRAAKARQAEAFALYKDVTDKKDAILDDLIARVRSELKQAEVDTDNDSARLAVIGWGDGASTAMDALQVPGPPRSLEANWDGRELLLDWKAAGRGRGGKAQVYEIERRLCPPSAPPSEWALVATALDTSHVLRDQPSGVRLEYRVLGKNKKGNSPPSPIAAILL